MSVCFIVSITNSAKNVDLVKYSQIFRAIIMNFLSNPLSSLSEKNIKLEVRNHLTKTCCFHVAGKTPQYLVKGKYYLF